MDQPGNAHVLNDEPVRAKTIKIIGISKGLWKLTVPDQCIKSHIDANLPFVGVIDGPFHILALEIIGFHTRIKKSAAYIDGICSIIDCCF